MNALLCSDFICPYIIVASLWTTGIIRVFFHQPFSSPSESMVPTLVIGDSFFASKTAYGYSKYSLPLGLIAVDGRAGGHAPERGDIVIFKSPADDYTTYVKRLIGFPGDRIQVTHGVLRINGKAVELTPIKSSIIPCQHEPETCHYFRETLPNGRSYIINEEVTDGPGDNTPEYLVPAGHYFMMGDNRDNSQDSRYLDQLGYIPKENIVGPAHTLFWNSRGTTIDGRFEGYPGVE